MGRSTSSEETHIDGLKASWTLPIGRVNLLDILESPFFVVALQLLWCHYLSTLTDAPLKGEWPSPSSLLNQEGLCQVFRLGLGYGRGLLHHLLSSPGSEPPLPHLKHPSPALAKALLFISFSFSQGSQMQQLSAPSVIRQNMVSSGLDRPSSRHHSLPGCLKALYSEH